ncbi:hypothetical protein NX779_03050 [Mycoplasma cottewii]|uniref:Uncharacterized protein n=1 Tax=Mycoplasma cottewii TaxID=51364 RepID=A0ABY5TVR7_9MOLU|nr:hypothetical protein [Mycoplasma cottewii]UWD34768.1 hypothetical protein NX779_03050 [Mycoplasma cottewii]
MKTFAIIFLIVVAGMFLHALYSVVQILILSFRSNKQFKKMQTETTINQHNELKEKLENEYKSAKKLSKASFKYYLFIIFKYLFISSFILSVLLFFILFSYIWFSYEEISTRSISLFIVGALIVVLFLFVILKEIYEDIKSWEKILKKNWKIQKLITTKTKKRWECCN